MDSKDTKRGSGGVGIERLLGRGSRVLGLASVARACGQRAGEGPWYVLTKQTTGPVEEVLSALEQNPDPVLLEAAVRAAMSDEPASALPAWTKPIIDDSEIVVRIGRSIDGKGVIKVVGENLDIDSPRARGLAALAIAFCRSRDTLDVLTSSFAREDRRVALQMGALANTLAEPLEPSSMRERIKGILAGKQEVKNG